MRRAVLVCSKDLLIDNAPEDQSMSAHASERSSPRRAPLASANSTRGNVQSPRHASRSACISVGVRALAFRGSALGSQDNVQETTDMPHGCGRNVLPALCFLGEQCKQACLNLTVVEFS